MQAIRKHEGRKVEEQALQQEGVQGVHRPGHLGQGVANLAEEAHVISERTEYAERKKGTVYEARPKAVVYEEVPKEEVYEKVPARIIQTVQYERVVPAHGGPVEEFARPVHAVTTEGRTFTKDVPAGTHVPTGATVPFSALEHKHQVPGQHIGTAGVAPVIAHEKHHHVPGTGVTGTGVTGHHTPGTGVTGKGLTETGIADRHHHVPETGVTGHHHTPGTGVVGREVEKQELKHEARREARHESLAAVPAVPTDERIPVISEAEYEREGHHLPHGVAGEGLPLTGGLTGGTLTGHLPHGTLASNLPRDTMGSDLPRGTLGSDMPRGTLGSDMPHTTATAPLSGTPRAATTFGTGGGPVTTNLKDEHLGHTTPGKVAEADMEKHAEVSGGAIERHVAEVDRQHNKMGHLGAGHKGLDYQGLGTTAPGTHGGAEMRNSQEETRGTGYQEEKSPKQGLGQKLMEKLHIGRH